MLPHLYHEWLDNSDTKPVKSTANNTSMWLTLYSCGLFFAVSQTKTYLYKSVIVLGELLVNVSKGLCEKQNPVQQTSTHLMRWIAHIYLKPLGRFYVDQVAINASSAGFNKKSYFQSHE